MFFTSDVTVTSIIHFGSVSSGATLIEPRVYADAPVLPGDHLDGISATQPGAILDSEQDMPGTATDVPGLTGIERSEITLQTPWRLLGGVRYWIGTPYVGDESTHGAVASLNRPGDGNSLVQNLPNGLH